MISYSHISLFAQFITFEWKHVCFVFLLQNIAIDKHLHVSIKMVTILLHTTSPISTDFLVIQIVVWKFLFTRIRTLFLFSVCSFWYSKEYLRRESDFYSKTEFVLENLLFSKNFISRTFKIKTLWFSRYISIVPPHLKTRWKFSCHSSDSHSHSRESLLFCSSLLEFTSLNLQFSSVFSLYSSFHSLLF